MEQHPSQQAQTPQPGVQQQFTAAPAAVQQKPPADEQASLAQGFQATQPFQQQQQQEQMFAPPSSSAGTFDQQPAADECQDVTQYAAQQQIPPEMIKLLEQIQLQATGQMVVPQPHKQFPAPPVEQQATQQKLQQQQLYQQQPMAAPQSSYDQFGRQQIQNTIAPAQLEQMLGSLPQLFQGQQQQAQSQQQPSQQFQTSEPLPSQQQQPGQQQTAGNPPISQIVGLLAELQHNLTTISQMQRRTQPVVPVQINSGPQQPQQQQQQAQPQPQQQQQPPLQAEQQFPAQQQQQQQQHQMKQQQQQQIEQKVRHQQQQQVPQANAQQPFVDPKQAQQGGHFIKFFVGGILYSAKEFDVEKYFQQFGQVVDVAIMRDKKTGRSRGFAFVTFRLASAEQVDMLKQALLTPPPGHPHVIQGRPIEVREGDGNKPADSFLGKTGGTTSNTPNEQQQNQQQRPMQNHHNVSGDSQQQNTQQNQPNRRRDSSREKGRTDRIRSRSRDRSQPRNNQRHGGNSQGNQNGQGGSFQDHQRRRENETERLERPGGTKDKVFVGGLDYQMTDEQFVGHFEEFGKVKEGQIVRDPVTNASRGFGFVTFINETVARRLIVELQKCEINGRMVDLRTAEPKLSEKIAIINKSFHEKSHSSGMGPGMNNNGNGNGQIQNFGPSNQKNNSNREGGSQFDDNKNRRSGNNMRNNNPSGGRERQNNRFGQGNDSRRRSNNQQPAQQEQQNSMLDFPNERPFSQFLGQHQYSSQENEFARSGGQGRKQCEQGGKRGQHPLIQEATGQGGNSDRRGGGGAGYSRPPPTQTSGLGKSSDQPGNLLDMDKPLFGTGFAADNFLGKYSTSSASAPRGNQQRGNSGNQNHQQTDSQIRADMSLASMKTSNERSGAQSLQKPRNSEQ